MLPPLTLLLLSLFSCSIQTKIAVTPAGSAAVDAVFTIPTATRDAWTSLRELDSTLPADPFDPSLLRQGLGPAAQASTTGTDTRLTFPVADARKLFPGWDPGASTWELILDRGAFRRIAGLTTWSGSPALEALLPAAQAKVTEADYRDLLVYLLGPGLSPQAAGALIDGSTVQVTLETPRPIRSAEGAVSFSGNTAVYRWPLVKVLVLATPIRLKVTF